MRTSTKCILAFEIFTMRCARLNWTSFLTRRHPLSNEFTGFQKIYSPACPGHALLWERWSVSIVQSSHISPRVSENRGLDFATRKQAENSQFEKDLITQENEINNNEAATEIIRWYFAIRNESQSFNKRKLFLLLGIFLFFRQIAKLIIWSECALIDSSWLGISTTKYFSVRLIMSEAEEIGAKNASERNSNTWLAPPVRSVVKPTKATSAFRKAREENHPTAQAKLSAERETKLF